MTRYFVLAALVGLSSTTAFAGPTPSEEEVEEEVYRNPCEFFFKGMDRMVDQMEFYNERMAEAWDSKDWTAFGRAASGYRDSSEAYEEYYMMWEDRGCDDLYGKEAPEPPEPFSPNG